MSYLPACQDVRWNYDLERWEQYGAGGIWIDYPEYNAEQEPDDE